MADIDANNAGDAGDVGGRKSGKFMFLVAFPEGAFCLPA